MEKDRFGGIKARLMSIAEASEDVAAVIAIGSSVRSCAAADEYSDIDLIIAAAHPEEWLYGDMPSRLGEVRISFVEPTLGGGLERRMLYDGSLDVDLIIFTPEQLRAAVANGTAAEVMNRGYSVMYDSMGIAPLIEEHIRCGVSRSQMSESEYNNRVQDFWFHTVWASKKILRGELWTAKMCIDAYLKSHLLSMMELRCAAAESTDVWHNGRFLEKWAGEDNVTKLRECFAHYDRADMITALKNTAALFSENARAAAALCGYIYPDSAEEYALSLVYGYFPE